MNNVSLDKGPCIEFNSAGFITRRTIGMVHRPGKKKSCQKNNVFQISDTTEILEAACQKIEVEHKCIMWRKIHNNSSIRRENASIPDKNYNKDKRAKIIAEEIDKSIVAYLEYRIQHFKSKAYYKASNDQHSINNRQEKFDILEEMMEAEREYRCQKIHFL